MKNSTDEARSHRLHYFHVTDTMLLLFIVMTMVLTVPSGNVCGISTTASIVPSAFAVYDIIFCAPRFAPLTSDSAFIASLWAPASRSRSPVP